MGVLEADLTTKNEVERKKKKDSYSTKLVTNPAPPAANVN
jgi:hypothetical protein